MLSVEQAKKMAKALRASLESHHTPISHANALELVARQLGYHDWNTASARLTHESKQPDTLLEKAIPILRMFDEHKAREFYLDFLDFQVEFEHRFEPGLPLYMGISRSGLTLHLSEHHGDASPGANIMVPVNNIEQLRDELHAKQYQYGRPEIVQQGWGKILPVYDPFGNRIQFWQH